MNQWSKPEYNYAYLMPFVIMYLIWTKRERLAGRPTLPSWHGIVPIAFGLVLYWIGELGGEFFTLYISFWLTLVGLCWIHLGWQKMRIIIFPLLLILTMFPLPYFVFKNISLKLQLISSQLGVTLLQAYGLPAYREGNVIDLAFTQLQVVEACSGLKTLISLLVLGLLLVYFFKAALWKKALLMISIVPIAIFANSVRIAATGILYEIWGAEAAEGFFHTFSGVLIFLFSLCLLLLELWILKRLPPRRSTGANGIGANDSPHQVNKQMMNLRENQESTTPPFLQQQSPANDQSGFYGGILSLIRPPQFIAAVLLLGATLFLSRSVEFREKIPITKPLDQFPVQVDEWSGTRQAMEARYIDALDFSDYVIIDYQDQEGKGINFYVAYYESQRKGESLHSPESCLPGNGWIFKEAGSRAIPAPGHGKGFIRVNRAFMHKNGSNQLSYYWFPERGRILTNLYESKIFTFWDALTKQRTDGALVRLITPVYDSEELKEAEKRLQAFTREILPLLGDFLPN